MTTLFQVLFQILGKYRFRESVPRAFGVGKTRDFELRMFQKASAARPGEIKRQRTGCHFVSHASKLNDKFVQYKLYYLGVK